MEQELRMLLKRPGNDVCADCGARYPRFASISLAVFLCNRCYGIHRSIGTHITRTKTVGLDRWSSDEVHRMSSIGNVIANSYWEENAPAIFKRPIADSPDFEVEKWIRDKYERKLFCSPSKEPPSVTPQMTEPAIPDASIRSASPQVKLLPRGTLRCGPDCTVPSAPGESSSSPQVKLLPRGTLRCGPDCTVPSAPGESSSSSAAKTTRDDFFFQVRSSQHSLHGTSGSNETLQNPFNQHSGTDHAPGNASESAIEIQSRAVYDDDEEFGDFVQA